MCLCVSLSVCHTFIHSLVDRHLDYFSILAIVNSASVNIGVHVSFQINVFVILNINPGGELLDHMVVLFSDF